MKNKKVLLIFIIVLTLFIRIDGVRGDYSGTGGTGSGGTIGATGSGCYETSYGIKVTVVSGKTVKSNTYSSTYGKGYTLEKKYKCNLSKWLYYNNGTEYNADVLNKCLDIPSSENQNRDYTNIAKIARGIKGKDLEEGDYIYIEPYTFCDGTKVALRTSYKGGVSSFCKNSNYRQVCKALANSAKVGSWINGYTAPSKNCSTDDKYQCDTNYYGNCNDKYYMCNLQNDIKTGYGIIVIKASTVIKKINIKITKKNTNNETITKQATFELCTAIKTNNGYQVCKTKATKSNGKKISAQTTKSGAVTFSDIKYKSGENTYYVCETKAPDGYNRSKKCSKVIINSSKATGGTGFTKSITFKNEKTKKGTLKIQKIYKDENDKTITGSTAAKFEIYDSKKSIIKTVSTKGTVSIGNLSPGKYYIKEKALSGYKLNSVSGAKKDGSYYQVTVSSNITTATFTNKKIKTSGILKVIKYETENDSINSKTKFDTYTKKTISFTIYGSDGKEYSSFTYVAGKTNVTIKLNEGNYYIKENKVDGYNLKAVKLQNAGATSSAFMSKNNNDKIGFEIKKDKTTTIQFINLKKSACDMELDVINKISNKNEKETKLLELYSKFPNNNDLLNFDKPSCSATAINCSTPTSTTSTCTNATFTSNQDNRCIYGKDNPYVYEKDGIKMYCTYKITSSTPNSSPFKIINYNKNNSIYLGGVAWPTNLSNTIFTFQPEFTCYTYYNKTLNTDTSDLENYISEVIEGIDSEYTIKKDNNTEYSLTRTRLDESEDVDEAEDADEADENDETNDKLENDDEISIEGDYDIDNIEEIEETDGNENNIDEEIIDCSSIETEDECSVCSGTWDSTQKKCGFSSEVQTNTETDGGNCIGNYCKKTITITTNPQNFYYGESLRWKFANLTGAATNSENENYIGYKYGIPVDFDENVGEHSINIIFNYKLSENSQTESLTHTCSYYTKEELVNGKKSKLNLEFRIVDTKNPFPGISGTGRKSGSNWTNKTTVITERNNSYSSNPILSIKLNTTNIKKIREYNSTHPNYGSNMECSNGAECKTSFVSELLNGDYGTVSSSCEKGENRNYCVGDSR